jgi:hypothetical protein
MIDIDSLEALAKDAAETGMAGHRIKFFMSIDPESVLALIAEVRALREIQAANVEIKMALNVEAQRYRWFRDWFLRGGLRMEIDPVGHIRVTTPDIVDAAIDAARGAK